MKSEIIIVTYSHPEAYPPILSAIEEFSKRGHKIEIICRNLLKTEWKYPANVTLTNTTEFAAIFESEKKTQRQKLQEFLIFSRILRKRFKQNHEKVFMINDSIPLFALFFATLLLGRKKNKIWYHNHDTSDIKANRKFSVGWWAAFFEPRLMKKLDIFSLPAEERKQFFNLSNFKGKIAFIPNFPKLEVWLNHSLRNKINMSFKILYQGTIGHDHGFEELLRIISKKNQIRQTELHLVGRVRKNYLSELTKLSLKLNCSDLFHYHGEMTYAGLFDFTPNFDLGIAIHKPTNESYSTAATASNKIFEYAASGLPVLFYDSEHYRAYYGNKPWAFFTDLSEDNLTEQVNTIISADSEIRNAARLDFENHYNYEVYFEKFYSEFIKVD